MFTAVLMVIAVVLYFIIPLSAAYYDPSGVSFRYSAAWQFQGECEDSNPPVECLSWIRGRNGLLVPPRARITFIRRPNLGWNTPTEAEQESRAGYYADNPQLTLWHTSDYEINGRTFHVRDSYPVDRNYCSEVTRQVYTLYDSYVYQFNIAVCLGEWENVSPLADEVVKSVIFPS